MGKWSRWEKQIFFYKSIETKPQILQIVFLQSTRWPEQEIEATEFQLDIRCIMEDVNGFLKMTI